MIMKETYEYINCCLTDSYHIIVRSSLHLVNSVSQRDEWPPFLSNIILVKVMKRRPRKPIDRSRPK